MARPPSNDIAHEQVTDHWIRKRVSQERLPLATTGDLVAVGGMAVSNRDLGLAYAQMGARGDEVAGKRALALLQKAERESAESAPDHDLHAQLGFLEQINGQTDEAALEYKQALAADEFDTLAAGDLALIEIERHNPQVAIRLWRSVLDRDPSQSKAGINLAITECSLGKQDDVIATLKRILLFSPDNQQARDFVAQVGSGRIKCGAR